MFAYGMKTSKANGLMGENWFISIHKWKLRRLKKLATNKNYLSLAFFAENKFLNLYFVVGSKLIRSCERPRLWVPTASPKSSNSCITEKIYILMCLTSNHYDFLIIILLKKNQIWITSLLWMVVTYPHFKNFN